MSYFDHITKKTSSSSYSYFDHNHHARFTSSSRLIEGHLRSCVEHLSVEWRSMLLTDMSTDSKTGIGRLSTDTHVGRYSVDTRPILNRHSAENWPILYRHCYWVLSYLIKYELIFSSLAILFFCIPCGKGRGDGCCFSKTAVNNTETIDSPPISWSIRGRQIRVPWVHTIRHF